MDARLLKYFIKRSGDTHLQLVDALGINESTLYRKFRHQPGFTQKEIKIIIERYKLTPEDVMNIFFKDK